MPTRSPNALRASGLVRNVNYDWAEKSKQLRIVVDQDRVRQAGLSSEQLAQALNRVITGSTVTQVRDSIYLIDVVARAESGERSSIEALRNLQITTPTGASVPLRELARFQYDLDEGYVWRRGRLPTITVQAEPLPGLEPAFVNQRIAGALEELRASMPAGTLLKIGGTVEKSEQSNAALLAQVPLMIALMLTVLMFQLGSFRRLCARDQRGAARSDRRRRGAAHDRHADGLHRDARHRRARRHDHPQLGDPRRSDRARAGARRRSLGGGDRRDQAQVPADHAHGGRGDPRHDTRSCTTCSGGRWPTPSSADSPSRPR